MCLFVVALSTILLACARHPRCTPAIPKRTRFYFIFCRPAGGGQNTWRNYRRAKISVRFLIKGTFAAVLLDKLGAVLGSFRGRERLNLKFFSLVLLIGLSPSLPAQSEAPNSPAVTPHAQSPAPQKVPSGVILVEGAWSSSSDSATPLPEGGNVDHSVYTTQCFALSYPLSPDWYEKYKGPPPSDSGYYVLAQLKPTETGKGTIKGAILVAALGLFFALVPARTQTELF